MAVKVVFEKPEGWPYRLGQAIPMTTAGAPPEIEFERAGTGVELKATQAREPTHTIKVSSQGGSVGTGVVHTYQGRKMMDAQGGAWATKFYSIPVDAGVPEGAIQNVMLDWNSTDTATVHQRENDHVADFERAYEMTWKTIERELAALRGVVFPLPPLGPADPAKRKRFIEGCRPTWFDAGGRPNQDFVDNFAQGRNLSDPVQLQAAIRYWESEMGKDYDLERRNESVVDAKIAAVKVLFQRLPPQLQPPVQPTDTLQVILHRAKTLWVDAMTRLAEMTRARDTGPNAEHSGDYIFLRYDPRGGVVTIGRVTSPYTPAPSTQVVQW